MKTFNAIAKVIQNVEDRSERQNDSSLALLKTEGIRPITPESPPGLIYRGFAHDHTRAEKSHFGYQNEGITIAPVGCFICLPQWR